MQGKMEGRMEGKMVGTTKWNMCECERETGRGRSMKPESSTFEADAPEVEREPRLR